MTTNTNYCLMVALLLVIQLSTRVAAAAPQMPPPKTQQAAVVTSSLTNADVTVLLKSGLGTEIVIAKINSSVCDFNTSTTALQELKGDGVPDAVILAMLQAPREGSHSDSLQATTNQPIPTTGPPEQATQTPSMGCMAVKPIGSHAFRNYMLLGVAGVLISHQQYQVVDVSNYPAHVAQKFHGNDLQTIESSGARVVLLPKHYTADDLHNACH